MVYSKNFHRSFEHCKEPTHYWYNSIAMAINLTLQWVLSHF